jgi:hypothetical protein
MPSYPSTIRRCQHIKVNGTQCGSPALRDEKYCYYHLQCHQKRLEINMNLPAPAEPGTITLPTLEDANSIQVGLAEVMRLVVTSQIDHRTAALLLHALRTASINLKHTSFEPEQSTHVVIDPESVERRPLGATAWSRVDGCEYDAIADQALFDKEEASEKEAAAQIKSWDDDPATRHQMLKYLIDRRTAIDPALLDITVRELRGLRLQTEVVKS